MNNKLPLIIDCDTGEDDAIALVLTAASGLPLKYVFTCHGNTTLENATQNSAQILSLVGLSEVKVIPGSDRPMQKHLWEKEGFSAGEDFLGRNGICNVELPPSRYNNIFRPREQHYIEVMAEILRREGPFDYIITGPCSNFARLIDFMGQEIRNCVRSLTIMGGAVHVPGTRGGGVRNVSHAQNGKPKSNSWAEFNFYCDPLAVKTTLSAGFNPIVVTWDACLNFELGLDKINRMRASSPGGKFVVDLMQAFMKLFGTANKTHFELCDPLTIMAYMGYGSLVTERINITLEKAFFGKSYIDPIGFPIQYFYTTPEDTQRIIDEMMKRLGIESFPFDLAENA